MEYSEKTANRTASENMSKPYIQLRIAEFKTQRKDLIDINATYVLNRLVEIDQVDVLDILTSTGELHSIPVLRRKSSHHAVALNRNEEVTREAHNVEESVKRMDNEDVDRELRENFIRPGSR
ncbi:terminase small subunit [Klebsiella quasipneumoniae]|uniref:terminase small subunit n=1 Tax=Klebsiella quasipneumoniae TaxID=1463165 RepID=UPI00226A0C6A|nr:terminase small subunit [Klebsiella quasipneumoniae]